MRNIKKYTITVLIFISLAIVACRTNTKNEETSYENMEVTDEAITNKIKSELMYYPEIPEGKINVQTLNGVVNLKGTVDNMLSEQMAQDVASAVKGVIGIIDNIEIETASVPNEQLELRVAQLYYLDPVVERSDLSIKADSGHVTLTGIVGSWSEKELAVNIAKSIEGVRSIKDNISIRLNEDRTDEDIKADIIANLDYDVYVDNQLIDVDVVDKDAILAGYVGSLSEKSKAITDAWVPGVDTVIAEKLEIKSWARDPLMRAVKYVKKSDEEIKNAVNKVFSYDARVFIFPIDVEVENGFVTLKGEVANLRAKNAAENDVINVVGVWGVDNQLDIADLKFEPKKARIDNVRTVLNIHPMLNKDSIDVQEEDEGKIVLTGQVKSQFEKQQAEYLISGISSVTEVENNLEVVPQTAKSAAYNDDRISSPTIRQIPLKTDKELKSDVEKELWWSPFVNEKQITVVVENGLVTLSGKVDTELERKYAEINAYKGGAASVINYIAVEFSPENN